MDNKINVLVLTVTILLIVTPLSGCIGDNGEVDVENGIDDSDTDDGNGVALTGEDTYSGEWEGSLGVSVVSEEFSGTWQFDVDFDEGTVEGEFSGDGSGDITGTVSDGIIEASGEAAFGVIEWSGDFSDGGESVSGTWEVSEDVSDYGAGDGTWSGSLGELDTDASESNGNDEEEEGLPEEDQVDGDEPFDRYPGSVMLNHEMYTPEGVLAINIEYGTDDPLDDVVDWYESELGDIGNQMAKEDDGDEVMLGYLLDESEEEWAEINIVESDWTTIEVEYAKGAM